ncbi:GRIP and coiled-coil domain-containing protein 2 [Blyttiomyces sp. JEL0837]|nr:GRIP and coiled-coil domain-containing protein 2 [Blyttiomyces sp. JEL0837]
MVQTCFRSLSLTWSTQAKPAISSSCRQFSSRPTCIPTILPQNASSIKQSSLSLGRTATSATSIQQSQSPVFQQLSRREYRPHVVSGASVESTKGTVSTAYFKLKNILQEAKIRDKEEEAEGMVQIYHVCQEAGGAREGFESQDNDSREELQRYLNTGSNMIEMNLCMSKGKMPGREEFCEERSSVGELETEISNSLSGGTRQPSQPPPDELADALASGQTDTQKLTSLALAYERLRNSHNQSQQELTTIKTSNATLETQLKELRLKAKLKITQLQRELESSKSNRNSIDGGGSPRQTAPVSIPSSPAPSLTTLGPDQSLIAELQAKVDALTSELEEARRLSAPTPQENGEQVTVSESNVLLKPVPIRRSLSEVETQTTPAPIMITTGVDAASADQDSDDLKNGDASLVLPSAASKRKNSELVLEVDLIKSSLDLERKVRGELEAAFKQSQLDHQQAKSEIEHWTERAVKAELALVESSEAPKSLETVKEPDTEAAASVVPAAPDAEILASLHQAETRLKAFTEICTEPEMLKAKLEMLEGSSSRIGELEQKLDSQGTESALRISELESMVETLRTAAAESVREKDNAAQAQQEVTQLKEANAKLQATIDGKDNDLKTKESDVKAKETELLELRAKLDQLQEAHANAASERNFSVEEQLTDYKIQIANRQKELAAMTESYQKSQTEWDKQLRDQEEKIKKLKGLLGQASKSLQESKRTQSEKDTELEQLRHAINELKQSNADLKSLTKEYETRIDRCERELDDEKEIFTIKLAEMEKQAYDAQQETANIKAEFQSFRIRAHAALQQNSAGASEERVNELEESLRSHIKAKSELEKTLAANQERSQELQSELTAAVEQLMALEKQNKRIESSSREIMLLRQDLESANRRIELEKEMAAEALKTKDLHWSNALETERKETRKKIQLLEEQLSLKQNELTSLSAISEKLSNDIATYRNEVSKLQAEADRAKSAAAAAAAAVATSGGIFTNFGGSGAERSGGGFFSTPPSMQTSQSNLDLNNMPKVSSPRISTSSSRPQNLSFAELLSRSSLDLGGSASPGGTLLSSNLKEKELSMKFEQISEMLAEAEIENQKLQEQERILKEEIRELERKERRSETLIKQQNVEYLKNVLLSFLETEIKEPLIPVIAKVLELSPDETRRLKQALAVAQEEKVQRSLSTFGLF